MDPESKKLLEKTFELVEENNQILHKIRRAQKIASFLRSIYWLIIIGVGIGAFYFVKPFFDQMVNFFQSSGETISNFRSYIP